MSKFIMECPNCGKYAEAKTGFFAKKKIDCSCGYVINVRTDKLTGRECPHCGNMVVFDQSKGADAKCPVCGEPINTIAEQSKLQEFACAQCGVHLRVNKAAETYTCPVCDHVNNVQERLMAEKIRKDGLISVIKYEGDNDTLIWKHPIEDFNYGTQLVVHESQEAIFFRDGQALDLFGPGRYTLETQQLPVLEKLYKLPTGGNTVFHSEVYFINRAVQMAVKWGTPEKIRFIDPLTGVPLEIGASGEMNLMVADSRKLLVKLVGTMKGISWDDKEGFTKSVQASFRPMITTAVKANLSSVIKDEAIDLLEVDEKLELISARLQEKVIPGFEEYGLTIPQFYVTNIVLPENDPNFKRIRELHTITLQTRVYQAEATVLSAKAMSEAQYRTAQEQSKAAIEAAHREAVLQQQTTETEVERRAAERKVISAQAEAEAQRLAGFAEAEVMRAKGYNEKDVIQAGVQKSYAEAIGNMGPAISAGGGGSGLMGDLLGLGVGMAAATTVAPQIGNIIKGIQFPNMNTDAAGLPTAASPTAPAPAAQTPVPAAASENGWDCPSCGAKGIRSKFCPECGAKKPEPVQGWICPECGRTGITSKFCPECGTKKPDETEIWTCPDCGTKEIKTPFCPECGRKKGE